MRSPTVSFASGLVLLALLCPGVGASAQVQDRPATVIGSVTERGGSAPVVGAFVTAIDESGARAAGSLADDEGRYALRVAPGRYRLRVQRIGVEGVVTEPFQVGPGQVVVRDLQVGSEAIDLEGVSVSGEARCDIRDDRSDTSRIWELARRALDVAAWSDEMGLYQYTSEIWRREYDAIGRQVVQEERTSTLTGQQAFRSLAADSLAEFGFVQGTEEDRSYFAPDAAVLLSDAFLATHCFRAVRDDARFGLAFEPVPGRDISDITGTLWLNENGLLERLEYEYVNLDGVVATARTRGRFRGRLGGEVRFEGLPNGGWIVRDWTIRMPQIGMEVDSNGEVRRRFLAGVVEVGAEVVAAEAQASAIDVPTRADLLSAGCEGQFLIELEDPFTRRGAPAVVGGTLQDAAGQPRAGAPVRVVWSGGDPQAGKPEWRGVVVRTDDQGSWFVCGVPNDVPVAVLMLDGEGEEASRQLLGPVEPGGRVWVSLQGA